jgi:hypothetical protein
MRIKASGQFNGVVDNFSCVATTICNDWDSASSEWIERATNNPASLFRHVLQGNANKRPLADAYIDLTGLQLWHVNCLNNGYAFNEYLDYQSSVQDVLTMIASAGRAAPTYKDGDYGVIEDTANKTPVQHFSPRNSWGFSGDKTFYHPPHALRCRFLNEDEDFLEDEVIVYADGYTSANATEFETVEFVGTTDPDTIWKRARYHMAEAKDRSEGYNFSTDAENIVCTRGDLILFSHDVIMTGVASGRIKELSGTVTIEAGVNDKIDWSENGSAKAATLTAGDYTPANLAAHVQAQMRASGDANTSVSYSSSTKKITIANSTLTTLSLLWATGANTATTCGESLGFSVAADDSGSLSYVSDSEVSLDKITSVLMDEEMPMTAETDYSIRFRLKTRDTNIQEVDTETTREDDRTLTFTTPISTNKPEVGDMGFFGVRGSETMELLVKSIRPSKDLSATLTCVDYAEDTVLTADSGAIPEHTSNVNPLMTIPTPDIDYVRSNEYAMLRSSDGSLVPRILVGLIPLSSKSLANIEAIEVQVRVSDEV